MKKLLVIFGMLVAMNANAQWVQVLSGMGNVSIYSLTISGNNLFAGTADEGVYLSTNNGQNWVQKGLENQMIRSLAVSGSNIFAGAQIIGVFRSTNNGINWQITLNENKSPNALATNENYIFAGTNFYGLYLSTNYGENWTQTAVTNTVRAIAISGNNVYAGTSTGIIISTNNGQNWTINGLNNVGVISIAISGNNIYAGSTAQGVYLSTNNGINWSKTNLINKTVYSIVITGDNIFAGTAGEGVYHSTNNGQNWIQKNEGFVGTNSFGALLIANDYIFAGSFNSQSVWRRSLWEIITGAQIISLDIPSSYSLQQNYPNPFNPTTKIKFDVAPSLSFPLAKQIRKAFSIGNPVTLKVYDVMGREIQTLVNESLKPGTYEATFDGSMLNSGVYFYKLQAGNFTATKKLTLLK